MATLRTDPDQSRRTPALRSVVVGTGSCLPERVVTNADLAERVDTSDEWIVQRTGIRQRHIASAGRPPRCSGPAPPGRRSTMPG